jgi:hypothetical protein
MEIDINQLTETELHQLNHRIVERLRFLQAARAHVNMLQFRLGERVSFQANGGVVRGVFTRYNKKSVTVITGDGHRWNVSPALLTSDETKVTTVVDEPPPSAPAVEFDPLRRPR